MQVINGVDSSVEKHRVGATRFGKLKRIFSFGRVHDEQLSNVVINQTKALIANIIVVTIIVAAFWDSALFTVALPWGLMAYLLTAGSLFHAKAYRYNDPKNFNRENAARYTTYFAGLRGLHWAFGLIAMLPTAEVLLQFVLGWVIIGMVSGGAFAYWSLPSAAFAYVAAIGLGGVIGFSMTGKIVCLLMAMALTVYCAFVLRHAAQSAALLREHVDTKKSLELSQGDLSMLLRHFEEDSSDWIWETSVDGKHRRNIDRFASALGCDVADLANKSWCEIVTPLLQTEKQSLLYAKFADMLSKNTDVRDVLLCFGPADAERIWKVSSHAKRTLDGSLTGWDGLVADITEQKRAEAKVFYLAHHDALTGLPNRSKFGEVFEDVTALYAGKHVEIYLLYIDLDGFKSVNDTLGHATGDQLLKQVCTRLQSILGKNDTLSRQGGDEFLALCVSYSGKAHVERLSGKICEIISEPFSIYDQHVKIGASVGVSALSEQASELRDVLREADLALYRAKAEGRGQVRFYEASMYKRETERQNLKADMRAALARNEFRLHYQPIVATGDGQVSAYEALLRWQHPTRGNVPPMDFIPLAEENGFIVEIGAWVLREACRQAALWNKGVRVSVNLSAVQIKNPQLLPTVVKALADTGLLPHRLELEVTETSLVGDKAAAFATLGALKALGVSISLDDFGTGYSSLAYLHEFPFDKIKIDRSFVQSCESRKQSAAVVNAVLGLAGELGMRTVAEGVETSEQLVLLTGKGCHEAQGYYLGKPQPASEIFPEIKADKRGAA